MSSPQKCINSRDITAMGNGADGEQTGTFSLAHGLSRISGSSVVYALDWEWTCPGFLLQHLPLESTLALRTTAPDVSDLCCIVSLDVWTATDLVNESALPA